MTRNCTSWDWGVTGWRMLRRSLDSLISLAGFVLRHRLPSLRVKSSDLGRLILIHVNMSDSSSWTMRHNTADATSAIAGTRCIHT